MSQISDEIKSKIDLADLISEYIQLKPAGANLKAVCPFHQEKTPSFMISRAKQIWHCFGCGAGGDHFGFIMKMEGLEFPEALRLLAEKAGVKLPSYSSEISSSARNRLLDVLKLAAKFYHRILLDSPAGEPARQYLKKRGAAEEMIEEFQLGFIPNEWDLLTKFLIKKGFGINDLIAAGLTVVKEREQKSSSSQSGYYDRFRSRIMFPIADVHGNIVGFTGRLLDESNEKAGGKYVNTPQTVVYDKSRVIYALDKAKQEIKRQNKVIVVEGQMDVIACHQAGQTNTVASSGTALTIEQIKLLKRFSNNLYIAFDTDLAGQNAAERGISAALEQGMQIKVIQIPVEAGKDPDECLKKNSEIWFAAVKNAESVMDYFFKKTLAEKDLSQPASRSEAAKILLTQITKIPDVIEQDFWLKKLAGILDVEISLLRERLADLRKPSVRLPSEGKREEIVWAKRDRQEIVSEELLAIVLPQPEIFKAVVSRVKTEALSQVYQNLFLDFLNFSQSLPVELLNSEVIHSFRQQTNSPEVCQIIDVLELLYEQRFAKISQENLLIEALGLVNSLNLWYANNTRRQIEKEMKIAEEKGDQQKIEELLKKFNELS